MEGFELVYLDTLRHAVHQSGLCDLLHSIKRAGESSSAAADENSKIPHRLWHDTPQSQQEMIDTEKTELNARIRALQERNTELMQKYVKPADLVAPTRPQFLNDFEALVNEHMRTQHGEVHMLSKLSTYEAIDQQHKLHTRHTIVRQCNRLLILLVRHFDNLQATWRALTSLNEVYVYSLHDTGKRARESLDQYVADQVARRDAVRDTLRSRRQFDHKRITHRAQRLAGQIVAWLTRKQRYQQAVLSLLDFFQMHRPSIEELHAQAASELSGSSSGGGGGGAERSVSFDLQRFTDADAFGFQNDIVSIATVNSTQDVWGDHKNTGEQVAILTTTATCIKEFAEQFQPINVEDSADWKQNASSESQQDASEFQVGGAAGQTPGTYHRKSSKAMAIEASREAKRSMYKGDGHGLTLSVGAILQTVIDWRAQLATVMWNVARTRFFVFRVAHGIDQALREQSARVTHLETKLAAVGRRKAEMEREIASVTLRNAQAGDEAMSSYQSASLLEVQNEYKQALPRCTEAQSLLLKLRSEQAHLSSMIRAASTQAPNPQDLHAFRAEEQTLFDEHDRVMTTARLQKAQMHDTFVKAVNTYAARVDHDVMESLRALRDDRVQIETKVWIEFDQKWQSTHKEMSELQALVSNYYDQSLQDPSAEFSSNIQHMLACVPNIMDLFLQKVEDVRNQMNIVLQDQLVNMSRTLFESIFSKVTKR